MMPAKKENNALEHIVNKNTSPKNGYQNLNNIAGRQTEISQ